MKGREFLDLARDLVTGSSEVYWRAAVVHAYYALMLERRDAQVRWGLPMPPRQSVHAVVRLRFAYASDVDLKQIGDALDRLVQFRNQASYDLSSSPKFASAVKAQEAVQKATAARTSLAAIDGNAARRAAAKASIHP